MRTRASIVAVVLTGASLGGLRGVLADEPQTVKPAPTPAPAPAPAPAASKPVEVWEGYVWRDSEKHVRLGWGVVAMGVMAEAQKIVEGPVAARLVPYATPKGDWVFWNYELERPIEEALLALPRALVRLEGHVEEGPSTDPPGMQSFPPNAPFTMKDARLTAIEFLDKDWLEAWAVCFREKASPWRIREDAERDPAHLRAFAGKALAALTTMRARPGVTEEQRATAKALDAGADVVQRFRRDTEVGIQRWLIEESRKQSWDVPGLKDLPPLPPSTTEIQGWFLDSATKAEFLAKVTKAGLTDLAGTVLVHYEESANHTSWTETDVLQVRDRWSEAEYARHRTTTQALVPR